MEVVRVELQHRQTPYDPVKAHEYYIRTRQLKGRRTGQRVKAPTYRVNLASGHTVDLSQQQLIEQRAYAAKRVNDIKNRLTELSSKLHKLMGDAKKQKAKSAKPTAADRSKAARESKKYRQSHKTALATKRHTQTKKASPTSHHRDPVATLEHKILQIKGNLQSALAKQRALAAATRNQ